MKAEDKETEAIDYLRGVLDGRKQGRKEVVEWIEGNALKKKVGGYRQAVSVDRIITEEKWQAFKKEMGIEDG